MNFKKNKGFSLTELIISIFIISILILGTYSLLKSLVFEVNSSMIINNIDNLKGSILIDIGRKIKDDSYEKSFYKISDILKSDDINYKSKKTPDPDKNGYIKTEDEFRKELKQILNNDGIYIDNGHIYGVLDEKFQKSNEGGIIDYNSLDDTFKEKLENYKICKSNSININGNNVCDMYNTIEEIDNNFGLLVLKKDGYIELYYINKGLLKQKLFFLDGDKNTNTILNTNGFIENTKNDNIKVKKFIIKGINKDRTFFNGDNEINKANIQIILCNMEYYNNNLDINKLFCR